MSPSAVAPSQNLTGPPVRMHGHTHHPHHNEGVLILIKALLEILVLALFVVTFIVQPYRIPSESMEPTLMVGDFLLVDKQSFGPGGPLDRVLPSEEVRRGDLVIFYFPRDPSRTLVKRAIGLPGDRIRLREGKVFINGSPLNEPYAFRSLSPLDNYRDNFPSMHTADPSANPIWWAEMRRLLRNGEIVVPENQYFVMGDNRNNSEDSRYWGFVERKAMVGRPLMVYFTTNIPETSQTAAVTWSGRMRTIWQQVRILR